MKCWTNIPINPNGKGLPSVGEETTRAKNRPRNTDNRLRLGPHPLPASTPTHPISTSLPLYPLLVCFLDALYDLIVDLPDPLNTGRLIDSENKEGESDSFELSNPSDAVFGCSRDHPLTFVPVPIFERQRDSTHIIDLLHIFSQGFLVTSHVNI